MAAVEIVLVFAVVIAVNVLIFRARRGRKRGFDAFGPPPPLPPHEFTPGTSLTFRGGARVGVLNVTRIGSRITFDEERAELRGAHPAVDISRKQVTSIRRVRFGRAGIAFDSADGTYDGVVFWGGRRLPEVLAGLQDKGWPTPGR